MLTILFVFSASIFGASANAASTVSTADSYHLLQISSGPGDVSSGAGTQLDPWVFEVTGGAATYFNLSEANYLDSLCTSLAATKTGITLSGTVATSGAICTIELYVDAGITETEEIVTSTSGGLKSVWIQFERDAGGGGSSGSSDEPVAVPAYRGPVIDGVQTVPAGSEVSFSGRRLNLVSSAYAGDVELSASPSVDGSGLALEIPETLTPGFYDLVLYSSHGKLTFTNGIRVLAAQEETVAVADRALTVGSFKGFVVIYTKGYEGSKLSAKIAGKWTVVEELSEDWSGTNYSRTVVKVGTGREVLVHLYIDGEFIRTEEVTTK